MYEFVDRFLFIRGRNFFYELNLSRLHYIWNFCVRGWAPI